MKRHAVLSRAFSYMLDMLAMLLRQSPSGAQPEPLKRIARGVLIALVGSLCLLPEAGGSIPKQYISYKEYAYYALGYNLKEYKCLSILYGKESAWNPKAVNGSHYGIPQGKSEWLRDQDGWTQVRWGLSYIEHRYSTPCNAYDHWKAKNWH